MTTLSAELAEFRARFVAKAPTEIREAMQRADAALAASGLVERAVAAGGRAPDFTLPDAAGRPVRLTALLERGPVVLSFHRGGWCPYCNLELRALQRALPEMQRLGATLVAVSPEKPDASLTTAERNALEYPVLSDAGSGVAASYGLAFDLAEELRPIYARFGHALPDVNGDGQWVLPVPATYVIDRDGVVALAHVDVDYRERLEPAEIIATLDALARARAGREERR